MGKLRRFSFRLITAATIGLLIGTAGVGYLRAATTPQLLAQGQPAFLGAMPTDPAAYLRAKAAAAARATSLPHPLSITGPNSITLKGSFQGIDMLSPLIDITPCDSTGAIGPSRYIETINIRYGIFSRTGTLSNSGNLTDLVGMPNASVSDPQMLWDPSSRRFYFTFLISSGGFGSDGELAWGFSKTSNPNTAADFCGYVSTFTYGTNGLPDYPKLGVDNDFLLIGVNTFAYPYLGYVGSDLNWISKPAGAITTCPALSIFKTGTFQNLRNADGSPLFTPVPARSIDPTSHGWVIGAGNVSTGSSFNYLTLYGVTKDASGNAALGAPRAIPVSSYSLPANAPQPGTSATLDTLDGRLTTAINAFDPGATNSFNPNGQPAIWTQQSIFGGAGSEVRWYEITPFNGHVQQSGDITDPSVYVFNGAISSDRLVAGSVRMFGSNMGVGFTTSSSTAFPADQMISKRSGQSVSPFLLIKQSPNANVDFSCNNTCRWGDYSAASPDPAASVMGTTGGIWFTNMWAKNAPDANGDIVWSTWNWAANP